MDLRQFFNSLFESIDLQMLFLCALYPDAHKVRGQAAMDTYFMKEMRIKLIVQR
jgi:hypothetical protein